MIIEATVTEEYENLRLDHFLNQYTGDEISRTSIQKWIQAGFVHKPGSDPILKSNYKVSMGEQFQVHIPPKPKIGLEPVEMTIPIVKEFDDFVIINKPAGIASHGGPGDSSPSLVNGLLFYFRELSKAGGEIRPGIVHRLDKPTSGLMIIAKNDRAHIALANKFQKREIEKTYY
ncbi:MAG: RluA family pseudouridine synthase, partial [Leptospira sp.]|nr:RluA family pseudouridine synthase [Leptospira sp.]